MRKVLSSVLLAVACTSASVSAIATEQVRKGEGHAGKDWFRSFLAHMDRCYRAQVVDLVVLTESSGTRAAAEFVIEGEYKVTDEGLPPARGQRYRLPVGAFFDVRDGLIRRVTNYYNLQNWIAQVSA